MTVPDIIKKVLTDAKIPSSEFKFNLQRSYSKREYCVQYRESELAFISRLMEEEGIYYWFEHSDKGHILIMADASSVHTSIAGDPKLEFHVVSGETPKFEHIYKFRFAQEVRPGGVMLRDFDFKKPKLDLSADKTADRDTELQIYEYPGSYVQPSDATTFSEIRLQELQTSRKVGEGTSNSKRLIPGYKFKMERHRRKDFNREYLLTRVAHYGEQVQELKEAAGSTQGNEYRADFCFIPSDLQFRPPRVTRRPVVYGSQTAIVTGPKGEEIYPDEHGRVKVQFHWDREGKRDEKSSCWIRVSQTWAGPNWGAIIIPRIGQEVVVQFLEGDPDRPIIMGTVYNGDNRPPFALPGGKSQAGFKSNSTIGGSGYNEFILDDTKSNELIRVHGQYDMDTTIEHDLREHVLHDRFRDVTNNEKIKIGVDQTYSIGSNQTGSVGTDKSLQIGGNHDESIGKNMTINVGADLTETIAKKYTETVGTALEITVGTAMTLGVGAAFVQQIGSSKSVTVAKNVSESVGENCDTSISGKRKVSVGKDDFLSVGKKLTVEAADQILIKTGKSSILLKRDGSIKIEGKDIVVSGSGAISAKASKDIILKGKKIAQN